jgi:hypothetical protein
VHGRDRKRYANRPHSYLLLRLIIFILLVALEAYEIANSMEPHDEEVKRHIATLQSILQEKDTSLHHGDSSGLMEEEETRKHSEKEGNGIPLDFSPSWTVHVALSTSTDLRARAKLHT